MPSNLVAALIMKDEEDVCVRCVTSLVQHVNNVIVSDTGSTDDTIAALLPLGIHVRDDVWHDFATNRNIVLHAAEQVFNAEYILCGIDADEILHVPADYVWPRLTADGYNIEIRYGSLVYSRMAIAKANTWEWKGVIHEALVPLVPNPVVHTLQGPWIEVRSDGARSKDPTTQTKDLDVLRRAVASEPGNARYQFYLAQTYKDLGMHLEAHDAYTKRANMPGWTSETAYAWYQAGRMAERLGIGDPDYYMKAIDIEPGRAEYLVAAAQWYRGTQNRTIAALFAGLAVATEFPVNGLFVETDVYEWRALDELVTVAYYTEMRDQGRLAARMLLQRQFPETERARIEKNCSFYL
jgi:tetratricopeptide (TPR) repeat protein